MIGRSLSCIINFPVLFLRIQVTHASADVHHRAVDTNFFLIVPFFLIIYKTVTNIMSIARRLGGGRQFSIELNHHRSKKFNG